MKREMVWIARSVSLKASTQVYTEPFSVSKSSGLFDRKRATSSTVQLEAGKCRSQRALPFSNVCRYFVFKEETEVGINVRFPLS